MRCSSWFHLLFIFLFSSKGTRAWFQALQRRPSSTPPPPRLALVTGGTGRTGRLVCQLLADQGFSLRILARNVTQAQTLLAPLLSSSSSPTTPASNNNAIVEFCQADMGQPDTIAAAFDSTTRPITHVVYTAGGDDTDYNAVSYQGVATCAQQAARVGTVQHFVFISTAWATRPYSIASLLFNSLYDTIPMACHFLGERELRRQATSVAKPPFGYVIVRPGGLNADERYQQKFPEVYAARQDSITYQQGDCFTFLGPAGRPGLCRSQLAHIVATATTGVTDGGHYTVEVTGSGNVNWDDASIYQTALQTDEQQDNVAGISVTNSEDQVFQVHAQAVEGLKRTAVAATLAGIALTVLFGWIQGIVSLVAVDALLILLWRKFYADRQV